MSKAKRMKHNLISGALLLAVTIFVITGFSADNNINLSNYSVEGLDLCYHVPSEDEVSSIDKMNPQNYLFLGKTYVGFKEALGFKESQGNYTVINKFGYLGKYQFGKSTLKLIGINNSERFIKDSKLQEAAFTANTSRNKWILRRDIKNFDGKYINGVKITESGILAAAHLAGAGNVKKYLRSGGTISFNDAFGTSIRYYLKKFSGYDTSFITANKKAKA